MAQQSPWCACCATAPAPRRLPPSPAPAPAPSPAAPPPTSPSAGRKTTGDGQRRPPTGDPFMKIRITATAILSLFAAGLAPMSARAGGTANFTLTGVPYTWDNTKSITYNIDQGPLGMLSNAKAAALVGKAFQQWSSSSIDTANLTFEEGDPLDRDVTGANLTDFMNSLPTDVNPVIFDSDGSVTDAILGAGASLDVLAFGQILQATPTGKIAQGEVVINGRAEDGLFGPDDLSQDVLTRATMRAIGFMLDLEESDLNDEMIFDGSAADLS